MARKLRNLIIDRIDLVDKGANQEAAIVLAKRQVDKESPAVAGVHVPVPPNTTTTPDRRKKPPNEKEKHVNPSLFKRMLAVFKETDPAKRDLELAAIDKECSDEPVDKEKDPPDPTKDKDKDKDKPAFLTEKRDSDERLNKFMVDMQKRLDAAEARATKAETDATAAATVAKAERDTRADRDMVDLLKSFKATPFNVDAAKPDNDVRKFRKMQDADPEGFARTMEILKAADAQLATAATFQNLGSARSGGQGDAWGQIEAKADELVSKSATAITREQAIDRVMDQNPALVKQYRQQQQ